MKRILLGSIVGAALVYFLDPNHGSKRRSQVKDLAGRTNSGPEPYHPHVHPTHQPRPMPPVEPAPATVNTPTAVPATSPAPAKESTTESPASAASVTPITESTELPPPAASTVPTKDHRTDQGGEQTKHDNADPDDNTLRDRVESEVFANTETGREHVNLNVVEGVVEVRGELPDQSEIDGLLLRILGVRDVKGVHSYLHLPGTPAPNKADVLAVS